MALPSDDDIQLELMRVLLEQAGCKLSSSEVYSKLAQCFPALTQDEMNVPYQNSVSHWANRVQFAVLHLRKIGWLHSPAVGERGVWEITPLGKAGWEERRRLSDELLNELLNSKPPHNE